MPPLDYDLRLQKYREDGMRFLVITSAVVVGLAMPATARNRTARVAPETPEILPRSALMVMVGQEV